MKILFSTLGSLGDLHPFLGLAIEMQKRGHDVSLFSSSLHRRAVETEGIPFFLLSPDLQPDDPELLKIILDSFMGPKMLHEKYIYPFLEENYESFLPHAKKADLIISSVLSYFAPIAADTTKTPWVSCLLSPICFWSAYDPPHLPGLSFLAKNRFIRPGVHRVLLRTLNAASGLWAGPVHNLRKKLGLPKTPNPMLDGQYSKDLVLATFSQLLATKQKDWPHQTRITGSIFYDGPKAKRELDANLEHFLQKGDAPLIFTLGSTAVMKPGNLFRQFVEIAKNVKMRAVLLVGEKGFADNQDLISEDIFLAPYAPYSSILPRGALTIHQGGVGTTGQAMHAGKPMLILPACMDQFDNAERVKRLGIAAILPKRKFNEVRASQLIRTLLDDPNVIQKAKDAGKYVESENGVKQAADAIEAQFKPRN